MKPADISFKHVIYIFTLLILSVTHPCLANKNTESISNQEILERAYSYKDSNIKQALALAQNAFLVSKASKNINDQANALLTMAQLEKSQSHHLLSKEYLEQAMQLLPRENKSKLHADILLNLGDIMRLLHDDKASLGYLDRALEIALNLSDPTLLSHIYNINGNIRKNQKENILAIQNYSTSLIYAQQTNDLLHMLRTHKNLGLIYGREKNFKKSIQHYLYAIALCEGREELKDLPYLYKVTAEAYIKNKNISEAMVYITKHIDLLESQQDYNNLIESYNSLANAYRLVEDFATSVIYTQKALLLAEKYSDLAKIAEILEFLSIDQRKLGQYAKALENSKRALSVQRELDNKERIAKLLLNISIIYRKLSSYDEALEYAHELIDIHEETNDYKGMAAGYNAAGLIYNNLGRPEDARHFYELTLRLPEAIIDSNNTAAAFRALADVLISENDYATALNYALRARTIYETMNSISGSESTNRTIGEIYKNLGEFSAAFSVFQTSLEQAREIKSPWSEVQSLFQLGELSITTSPSNAENYVNQGIEIAKKLNAEELLVSGYSILEKLKSNQKDYKSALYHAKEIQKLIKKIAKDEVNQRVAELRIVRETEKRDREILELKKEAKLNKLKMNSAEIDLEAQHNKSTIAELELGRNKNIQIILIGLSLVIGLAIFILYSAYRHSAKKQAILNETNLQIEAKKSNLEELNANKDRFFSIIAHDLRGPISSVSTLAELLHTDYFSFQRDVIQSNIQAIHNTAQQSLVLLNELLEWALIQLKNTQPLPRIINIKELCDNVIKNINETANNKKIIIVNKVDSDAILWADRNMLQTVLRNLLSNALKFTDQFGQIEIFNISDSNYETIHVKDTGIGISPDDIKDLFDLSKRISREGTAGEQGTGFGLILCKELIEKNGGDFFVTSKKNKGSDLYFRMPHKKHLDKDN